MIKRISALMLALVMVLALGAGAAWAGTNAYKLTTLTTLTPNRFIYASDPGDSVTFQYSGSSPKGNLTAVVDTKYPYAVVNTGSPSTVTVTSLGDGFPRLYQVVATGSSVDVDVEIAAAGDYITLSSSNGAYDVHVQLSPNNSTPVAGRTVSLFAIAQPSTPWINLMEPEHPLVTGTTNTAGNYTTTINNVPAGDVVVAADVGLEPVPISGLGTIPPWLVSWQTWESAAPGSFTFPNTDLKLWPQVQYIGPGSNPGCDMLVNTLTPGAISNVAQPVIPATPVGPSQPANPSQPVPIGGNAGSPGQAGQPAHTTTSGKTTTSGSLMTPGSTTATNPAGQSPVLPIAAGIVVAALLVALLLLPLRPVSVAISLLPTGAGAASLFFDDKKSGPRKVIVDLVAGGEKLVSNLTVTRGQTADVTLPEMADKTVLTAKTRRYRNVSKNKSVEFDPQTPTK